MAPNFLLALVLVLGALLGPAAAPAAVRASQSSAAAQAVTYSLSVSKSSDRSNAGSLPGQTVAGNIYVFVTPDTGAGQVRFYLDNPSASGTPLQVENNAPYDFAGGSSSGANAYDTTKLSNGSHSITASIDLAAGGVSNVTATFTVSNGAAATAIPPTATKAAPTATQVAPTPQTAYNNLVSKSANRSSAGALQGQTVSGSIYVFVSPESGITQVRFFVDNPSASGTPLQTENGAPYDFAGGTSTAANPYDTTRLANGAHSITASITLTSGVVVVTTANFNVNNGAAVSTPAPTATKQPTATPQAAYNNLLSKAADRSAAGGLNGQTVSGSIYVFVSPESGATKVDFFLDNTGASGTPYHTESNAPWDFAGGSSTAATAFDTRSLGNGGHTITAAITLSSGTKSLTTASFTVNNASATSTPAPGPTATPAPSSGSIYWGVNMSGVPGIWRSYRPGSAT